MQKFQIKRYRIRSEKIHSPLRLCFLTDWHASERGLSVPFLTEMLRREKPDAVLIGGDMATALNFASVKTADRLLRSISGRQPVFYARGNHETRLYQSARTHARFMEYEKRLTSCGVRMLDNSRAKLEVRGQAVTVYGYSVPMGYYRKPFPPSLTEGGLGRALGTPDEKSFCILLAHTPMYADRYFAWGADLTLCGHYHGGVIRFDEHHGAVSPQLVPFPPYCCGDFYHGSQALITSAGLGEHGFLPGTGFSRLPLRYNNPRELVTVDLEEKRDGP